MKQDFKRPDSGNDVSVFALLALLALTSLLLFFGTGTARADEPKSPPPGAQVNPPTGGAQVNPTPNGMPATLPPTGLRISAPTLPVAGTDAAKPTLLPPGFKTVTPAEYAVFGSIAAADAATLIWLPAPSSPRWTATNSFDMGVRNALRLNSASARSAVDTTSTALVGTLAAFPILIDAAGIAGLGHKDGKATVQMLAVDGEAFATILGALQATKDSVARARPYMQDCPNSNCNNSDRYESFFSGHTSLAFNSAGLICSNHLNMHLWGSSAADIATCASALATASAVGVMRIAADDHWATDVLAGAALGSLTGFLIPQLHFGFGSNGKADADGSAPKALSGVTVAVSPVLTSQMQGFGVSGAF